MTCEETRKAFSPFLDGALSQDARAALDSHLDVCPVCRHHLEEVRHIVRGLSLVRSPAPPAQLSSSIREALKIERAARLAQPELSLSESFARWLQPRLMPYAVGAFYSALLFFAVFGALRYQLQILHSFTLAQQLGYESPYQITSVGNEPGGYDINRPLSPESLAAARSPYSYQSPSLNPRGALAALTYSPSRRGAPGDDDMIVVADVYGNGRASLAAVVAPPRNAQMIDELEFALRKNPAFVPAKLDQRPQTMRVVFVLQKMDVQDKEF